MSRADRPSGGRREPEETTGLFDLPLVLDPIDPPENQSTPDPDQDPERETAAAPELLFDPEPAESTARELEATEAKSETSVQSHVEAALLRRRLVAGLFDLAVTTAAWTILLLSALFMGAGLRASDWPGYLLALASFSFVYTVYSLVFWGRTPGMRRARLAARSTDGSPITFNQAVRRWLGGAVTTLLLGLPGLPLLRGGRPLSDYVSDSSLAG